MKIVLALLSDEELAERFNQGDNNAFGEIYERYWLKLYLHAVKMLKDKELAEDAVHDVFSNLLLKGSYINPEYLKSFLYKSLKNHILNQIRRENIRCTIFEELGQSNYQANPSTEDLVIEKELWAVIDKEICLLPPRVREIFNLSRKEQLSHREISARTGSTEGTIKKQINFALKVLKGKLGLVSPLIVANVIHWLIRFR